MPDLMADASGPIKGPVFYAKHDGWCGGCGGLIVRGDRCRMIDGEACHAGCE